MAIKYYTEGTDFRLPSKGRTAAWIRRATEGEGRLLGAVNFIFCSPARHLEINRAFLGHDWATDVITFDYSEVATKGGAEGGAVVGTEGGIKGGKISGDIFIDPATVAANAADLCVAPEVEMRRVMIHGVLHLCGMDDKTLRQRKLMRDREDFYLAKYYETV